MRFLSLSPFLFLWQWFFSGIDITWQFHSLEVFVKLTNVNLLSQCIYVSLDLIILARPFLYGSLHASICVNGFSIENNLTKVLYFVSYSKWTPVFFFFCWYLLISYFMFIALKSHSVFQMNIEVECAHLLNNCMSWVSHGIVNIFLY